MTVSVLAPSPVIPVVVIDDAAAAPALAAALLRGGIRSAEITLRTPAGLEAVRAIAGDSDAAFTVGAGTVLDVDQFDAAVAAGAPSPVSRPETGKGIHVATNWASSSRPNRSPDSFRTPKGRRLR